MGTKPVVIRFCDKCFKELVGRLTFRTCPCCGKDVCLSCIDKENSKHKPRERKPKAEQGSGTVLLDSGTTPLITGTMPPDQETEKFFTPPEPKKRGRPSKRGVASLTKPDISTFSIRIPEPNSSNPHYTLSLDGVGCACLTLKEGIKEMLALAGIDQKYVEDAPDSEGKRNLLEILKETPTPS